MSMTLLELVLAVGVCAFAAVILESLYSNRQ